jgi:hypothetical protein
MLLTSVILFAAAVTGFTIPPGLADGTYIVDMNQAGVEIFKRLEHNANTVTPRVPIDSAKFMDKRQVAGATNTITCANEPLNHVDTKDATTQLNFECDLFAEFAPSTGPTQLFVIRGCTVAYFCNFKNTYAVCTSSQVNAVLAAITTKCGSYVSGWDRYQTSSTSDAVIGYEDFCSKGNNFCGVGSDGH